MNRTPHGRQGTHLILGVCAAIGLAAPGAGQPRDRPADVTGTAGISGRVLTLAPRAPLSEVVVVARAENGGGGGSAFTDADGRYAVSGLPAGRYTLTAQKRGYVTLQFGQTRAFEQGTPLQLESGETLTGIDLQLPRGGVMTGRVLDQHGQSAVGVAVSAQRYRFALGRWDLVSAGSGDRTDDRGVYRLYGLPPGDYYVGKPERRDAMAAVRPVDRPTTLPRPTSGRPSGSRCRSARKSSVSTSC